MGGPKTFPPGESIVTLGVTTKRLTGQPQVHVSYPHRVHITPVDCNRFGFGEPGGAGVGFAVELRGKLSLRISDCPGIRSASRDTNLVVEHFLLLALDLAQTPASIEYTLNLPSEIRQHSGLGSHSCLATATLVAASRLLGIGLTDEQVRRLVGFNFVEIVDGALSRGLETGVGPLSSIEGGCVLVGGNLTRLDVCHRLDGTCVALVWPETRRPDDDKPESLNMLKRSLRLDAEYAPVRAYRLIMDFWPAVARGDMRAAGDVAWDFQFSGTHQSMIQAYDDGGLSIYRTISQLKKFGVSMTGMSSVGPMIYALDEDPIRLRASIEALGDAKYVFTSISETGVKYI